MRTILFSKKLFSALFRSGAWYWRALWFLIVFLLLGAPPWLEQKYPAVAKMLSDLGIPYWAYGLAASVVVAIYFAWRIAAITTPRIIPIRLDIGYPDYDTDAASP